MFPAGARTTHASPNQAIWKGLSSQNYTSYVRYDSTLLMFQQVPRSKSLKASNAGTFEAVCRASSTFLTARRPYFESDTLALGFTDRTKYMIAGLPSR